MEAAFFDLDKTIISRSSSLALSRPMYRAGMVSRSQLLRGAYGQLVYLLVGADEKKLDRLRDGMLALTKGWDRAQVEQLVQEVIVDVIDPFVYQEALDLIELHRSERRRIYIVSSSPEEVVRPLARYFGVREQLSVEEDKLREILHDVQATGVLSEAVVVSTCNRVEVYGVADVPGEARAACFRHLCRHRGIEPSGVEAYLYTHLDADAVRHAFRVAASLDSMLVGEPQILGQIKDAFALAQSCEVVGPTLHTLFTQAFAKTTERGCFGRRAEDADPIYLRWLLRLGAGYKREDGQDKSEDAEMDDRPRPM